VACGDDAATSTTAATSAATQTTAGSTGDSGSQVTSTPATVQQAETAGGYSGMSRSFLWNQDFHQMVDTLKYKKEPPYVIGFSNASISNVWRVSLLHSVQYHASLHKDVIERLLITDAADDVTKQIADIQDLLQKGVDILIVSAAQSAALDPIITQATTQGVPVVMVDRRVDSDNFVTFVTASDQALGRFQATWLVEKLGGEGGIVMLPGLAGSSPAELRIQAAKEIFAQYPGIEILDMQYTDWSPTKGKQVMSALIQKYGEQIKGVWSDHGLQGSGAIEAFVDAGYKPGEIPPITGADLNRQLQLAIQNDVPCMWMNYPPAMGGAAVEVALQVLNGASVPHIFNINTQIVVTRGDETPSVYPDVWAEDYVMMDKSGDIILSAGIPGDYDPQTYSVDYPK
jgi:ribose transport system substrate-binding protein